MPPRRVAPNVREDHKAKWCSPLAITLTLPKLHHVKTMHEQYEHFKSAVKSLDKLKLSLVVELTKALDVHCHGFVSMQMPLLGTPRRYIRDYMKGNPKLGFSCLKVIDDEPGWAMYCQKDIEDTRSEGLEPILVDDLKYFNKAVEVELEESPMQKQKTRDRMVQAYKKKLERIEELKRQLKAERGNLLEMSEILEL